MNQERLARRNCIKPQCKCTPVRNVTGFRSEAAALTHLHQCHYQRHNINLLLQYLHNMTQLLRWISRNLKLQSTVWKLALLILKGYEK